MLQKIIGAILVSGILALPAVAETKPRCTHQDCEKTFRDCMSGCKGNDCSQRCYFNEQQCFKICKS